MISKYHSMLMRVFFCCTIFTTVSVVIPCSVEAFQVGDVRFENDLCFFMRKQFTFSMEMKNKKITLLARITSLNSLSYLNHFIDKFISKNSRRFIELYSAISMDRKVISENEPCEKCHCAECGMSNYIKQEINHRLADLIVWTLVFILTVTAIIITMRPFWF